MILSAAIKSPNIAWMKSLSKLHQMRDYVWHNLIWIDTKCQKWPFEMNKKQTSLSLSISVFVCVFFLCLACCQVPFKFDWRLNCFHTCKLTFKRFSTTVKIYFYCFATKFKKKEKNNFCFVHKNSQISPLFTLWTNSAIGFFQFDLNLNEQNKRPCNFVVDKQINKMIGLVDLFGCVCVWIDVKCVHEKAKTDWNVVAIETGKNAKYNSQRDHIFVGWKFQQKDAMVLKWCGINYYHSVSLWFAIASSACNWHDLSGRAREMPLNWRHLINERFPMKVKIINWLQ